MQDLVKLLKTQYVIEQRIRSLKNIKNESSKDPAQQLLAKLNEQLLKVKAEIAESDGYLNPATYSQKPDHEVQMARSQLYRTAKKAIMLHKVLQELPEENGLEGWVQAKITKASDYLDAVWAYLSYEMRFPYDESVEEAVAAYGPGEDPNTAQTTTAAKPGQTSPTPPAGGSTPGGGTPGMVKMAKLGPDKKPTGTPIMVRSADIINKQKQGYAVIGEAKGFKTEYSLVIQPNEYQNLIKNGLKMWQHRYDPRSGELSLYASNPRTAQQLADFLEKSIDFGATSARDVLDIPYRESVRENASAGATSAGGIAGSPTGFASGGIGMQKRKKKVKEDDVEEAKDSLASYERRMGYKPSKSKTPSWEKEGEWSKQMKKQEKAAANQELKRREKKTEGTMADAEKEGTGPKFTGYYKGKDKGRPGKKMVGGD